MNHYECLDKNFPIFLSNLGKKELWDQNAGIIGAQGDKC